MVEGNTKLKAKKKKGGKKVIENGLTSYLILSI